METNWHHLVAFTVTASTFLHLSEVFLQTSCYLLLWLFIPLTMVTWTLHLNSQVTLLWVKRKTALHQTANRNQTHPLLSSEPAKALGLFFIGYDLNIRETNGTEGGSYSVRVTVLCHVGSMGKCKPLCQMWQAWLWLGGGEWKRFGVSIAVVALGAVGCDTVLIKLISELMERSDET